MGLDIQETTDRYFARIHRAALVLTGDPWAADDLAQETFLVLAGQGERFRGLSSPYTWLYGILLNLERRERRRRAIHKRKLQVIFDGRPNTEPAAVPAAAPVEAAEWKRSLWARVAGLSDGQRQTLVLRFSEGLRYEEIAEVLDCPLGTVKSRIFHGLGGLRRILEEESEDVRQIPPHPRADINHAI